MGKEIRVPRMGESITDAHIGQIFKKTGSHVEVDDEVLELETDKVNQVVYAPASGTVTLTVNEGDLVKIEQVIGSIEEGAAPKEDVKKEEPAPEKPKPLEESKPPAPEPKTEEAEKVRIFKDDYIKDIKPEPAQKTAPPPKKKNDVSQEGSRVKMSRIRQTIAARLVEAKSETAMLTTFNEVDLTKVIEIRAKYKEEFQKKYGVKLGFMSFFIKACLSALKEFPLLNSYIEGDEIVHKGSFDMGVAVSSDRGLVVPVLKNADTLSFDEIEREIEVFSKKAREGGLSIDDIKGGTFTITNGGTFGSLLSTPILNFPQSGILGMHKIMKRPVVVDDEIVIRSMMYIALTYDHRIVDGKDAVLFLVHVKNHLEDPERFTLGL